MFSKLITRKGKTPFSGFISGNAGGKAIKKDSRANLSTLKESVTLLARNMYQPKVSKPPLPEFIYYSKTLLDE